MDRRIHHPPSKIKLPTKRGAVCLASNLLVIVEAARKEKKGARTQESYNQLWCYLLRNTQEF